MDLRKISGALRFSFILGRTASRGEFPGRDDATKLKGLGFAATPALPRPRHRVASTGGEGTRNQRKTESSSFLPLRRSFSLLPTCVI